MKLNRTIALALLVSLLLALPVMATAGMADDPLITRSYAEGTFMEELSAALDRLCALAMPEDTEAPAAAELPAGDGWMLRVLGPDDYVILGDGQQLVLVSGLVRFSIVSGRLINCTLGRPSTGGEARTGHRYVAWNGAAVRAECSKAAVVACSAGAEGTGKPLEPGFLNPFDDVPDGAWYAAAVLSAVRRGLVNGMTPTTYAPQGNLTLAQTVKLAACMHQLYNDGAVTLGNAPAGQPWYDSYAAYAVGYGILDAMPEGGWDDAVTRAEFVRLFYRAMPWREYAEINRIGENAIPDLPGSAPGAREVYIFYAAGILTGYAEGGGRAAHAFGADTFISRAEVATIMNRMFDADARVRFELE